MTARSPHSSKKGTSRRGESPRHHSRKKTTGKEGEVSGRTGKRTRKKTSAKKVPTPGVRRGNRPVLPPVTTRKNNSVMPTPVTPPPTDPYENADQYVQFVRKDLPSPPASPPPSPSNGADAFFTVPGSPDGVSPSPRKATSPSPPKNEPLEDNAYENFLPVALRNKQEQ
ncbi:hypothetical protein QR680_010654 [Steinernema hermaphroditum]|uniref:Uncharacterized protein n=1 Tax=Steinernema hermaphroditum TaxID=289476 RepID=A0AA39MB22_9BILA|nr:hypothetical protein QR680_010654 [Steinernema hermaphroditum]